MRKYFSTVFTFTQRKTNHNKNGYPLFLLYLIVYKGICDGQIWQMSQIVYEVIK